MAIAESVGRIGATLVAMVQTRLELAAVEVQEELQRFLGYVVLALASLILFGIAALLVVLLVVVIFWDSYRLQAIGAMAVLFGVAGGAIAMQVKRSFDARPRLLGATVAELNKDVNFIRNAGHDDE
ncbi:phage holin family protein [Massilia antarctica]|uniref:phage holin family protein n=1 Tax=Massilia antarctica TaxID=2765360 RepID=UPI0006BB9055|nr:phage holin family protein [Massilia sp. H27-R4]MCY0912896.1 phage holin family protein [Massilia sp. H27-R4]CUI07471.1 Probable transmembrane protein [Janthinobacterium sp. CG23_2]CUU31257.1 Probable transmembrane protein [Janthinobacterium sp. CG23_2]